LGSGGLSLIPAWCNTSWSRTSAALLSESAANAAHSLIWWPLTSVRAAVPFAHALRSSAMVAGAKRARVRSWRPSARSLVNRAEQAGLLRILSCARLNAKLNWLHTGTGGTRQFWAWRSRIHWSAVLPTRDHPQPRAAPPEQTRSTPTREAACNACGEPRANNRLQRQALATNGFLAASEVSRSGVVLRHCATAPRRFELLVS
jgi:hypothetical protein